MLGPRVGVPARTVSRILRRHRVRYLRVLDPMTGEAIRSSKTTAVRYKRDRPGELVHMDQVTRSIALVAADQFSGGPVQVGQPVQPASDQHCVHRGGRDPEKVTDRHRTQPVPTTQAHDPPDHARRRAVMLTTRSTRAVPHSLRALDPVPLGPLVRGPPRHVESLGRPSDGPALINHQLTEPEPGAWSQGSIGMGSVRHEDLLVWERNRQTAPLHTRRSSPVTNQISSSHKLDQRDWTSHLGSVHERLDTDRLDSVGARTSGDARVCQIPGEVCPRFYLRNLRRDGPRPFTIEGLTPPDAPKCLSCNEILDLRQSKFSSGKAPGK
jgi:hypothetical protein